MVDDISKIKNLLETKRFADADIAIKEAIAKYPDSPELINLYGELQLNIGNLDGAKKIFLDIRKKNPDNLEALNNLAVCLIYENDWERAINLLLEVLRKDHSNAVAKEHLDFIKNEVKGVIKDLVLEAKNNMKKGLTSKAEEYFSRVIDLDNMHIEASIYLAAIKMKNGRFEKAEKILSTVNEKISTQIESINTQKTNEDTIERNMYWIFGSGRSGSTWLSTKLLNHEGTICWDEPLIGTHLANTYWERDKSARLLDRDTQRPGYFFSSELSDIWKQYLRKMIIQRVFAQYPNVLKKKVIIKEPNGSFAADIIMQTLPQSKIIFLLRDGRDILDSILDMHKINSWAQKLVKLPELDEAGRRGMIIKEAVAWKQRTEIVQRTFYNHEEGKRLLIKYEELRYDTFAQLRRIYDFIGISISDEELRDIIDKYSFENIPKEQKGEGKAIRKAKPGAYKDSFSEEEIEIMNSIMGEQLRKYGYEV